MLVFISTVCFHVDPHRSTTTNHQGKKISTFTIEIFNAIANNCFDTVTFKIVALVQTTLTENKGKYVYKSFDLI